MMTSVALVIGIPFVSAAVLVLVPGYRISAAGNVLAMFATFLAGVSLLFVDAGASSYFIIDDMNILFIILNTLVGFTTSVFSASYISHEIETGKLTPQFVRFYHAMFLGMMGAMNVALTANNIGLMWVGLELSTLITVVMVGIYRTPSAIEASWKYFCLLYTSPSPRDS